LRRGRSRPARSRAAAAVPPAGNASAAPPRPRGTRSPGAPPCRAAPAGGPSAGHAGGVVKNLMRPEGRGARRRAGGPARIQRCAVMGVGLASPSTRETGDTAGGSLPHRVWSRRAIGRCARRAARPVRRFSNHGAGRVLACPTSAVRVGWYCKCTAVGVSVVAFANLKCTSTRMIAKSCLCRAELQL